jgi:hypothetical protein
VLPNIGSGADLLLQNGQFGFTVTGQPEFRVEIQVSSNLLNWTQLTVLTNTAGTMPFSEPVAGQNSRFYRLRQFP